jgi:DNA-binding NarL/FixJ family response regulator
MLSTSIPATTTRRPYRVAIVEDHTLVRDGFRSLIQSMPDFEFAWWAGSVSDALANIETDCPDLLTTDISLPDGSGLDIVKAATARIPPLNVLVMSIHDESLFAQRSLKAGAKGYLMKTAPQDDIEDALRKVATGRIAVSSDISEMMVMAMSGNSRTNAHTQLQNLSDREFEIFQLIGEGQSSHLIGKNLEISPKTVDVHKMNIRKKLKLDEGTTLTAYAIRWSETQRLSTSHF